MCTFVGGVPQEQRMLTEHLPRVIHHQVYQYTKISLFVASWLVGRRGDSVLSPLTLSLCHFGLSQSLSQTISPLILLSQSLEPSVLVVYEDEPNQIKPQLRSPGFTASARRGNTIHYTPYTIRHTQFTINTRAHDLTSCFKLSTLGCTASLGS